MKNVPRETFEVLRGLFDAWFVMFHVKHYKGKAKLFHVKHKKDREKMFHVKHIKILEGSKKKKVMRTTLQISQ